MKAYLKDILKEITHSLGRFLSILLIVAIGTAFFAGVKASVPDMKNSADAYFDEQNLMDIRMLSTMGFNQEDVDAIKKVKGIEGINATYAMDFLADKGTSQLVVKAIAWEDLASDDPNNINQVRLEKGRLPKNENECLIESEKIKQNGYQIGDTITLKSGTTDAIDDYLKQTTFTIVGTCNTPDYLSYVKGSSTIGSGSVDTFIMIPKSNYVSEYFSEILISVKQANAENTYSDQYFTLIDPVSKALEKIKDERMDIRYQEIQEIAQRKWNENNQKYEDNKKLFNDEISAAEKALADAKNQLTVARTDLANGKASLEANQASANVQIAQAQTSLNTINEQLQQAQAMQAMLASTYDQNLNALEGQITLLNTQINDLKQQLNNVLTEQERQEIEAKINALQATITNLESQKATLIDALQSANQAVEYLSAQQSLVSQKIESARNELQQATYNAQSQFANAEKEITQGQATYDASIAEFKKKKSSGEEELAIAAENLAAAKEQLKDLPQPTWYVLDRNAHYSYRDYESVADRMDGIAKVFPVFFLIVAALVCLTTMTRMVDEQRGVIGTYKALGYSKVAIATKYLVYALSAGIIGSILGCAIGMHLFPSVIFNAWNLMYNLPGLVFTPQIPLAVFSSVCVIGVTLIAAAFACYKELMEVPASLMRPKAPKQGKKILLERIPLIWSHFSFTMKVTARNIFRYKKRFFMTIIGISGCTALLLSGFGIKDSIAQIVDIQYSEITKYDVLISLDNNASLVDRRSVIEEVQDYELSKEALAIASMKAKVEIANNTQSVSIIIPDDAKQLKDYISLRSRTTHEVIPLAENGAVVSEKLAKNLNASVGDKIRITFDDDIEREIKINAITENYVGHMIYMTPSYYKQLTSKRVSENTVLLKMKKATAKTEQQIGNYFVKNDAVSSITFYRGVADSFADTINSISFITYVLIGAAGLLAFVVLYNLTNVNISERLREIATIKVLGFYDLEVASYVYRENIFLTIIGSFVGLALGIFLHQLIMNLAEMPEVMFGRNISPFSFIISIAITIMFGLIVNLAMYRKLQRIPMVESLKSVE